MNTKIEYDDVTEGITQRYVVYIDGVEWRRFLSYSKAENTLAWHVKQGMKTENNEPITYIDPSREALEFSHISKIDKDCGIIERESHVYLIDNKFVCFVELDLYSGEWFNGDGCFYSDWREAGQMYVTSKYSNISA